MTLSKQGLMRISTILKEKDIVKFIQKILKWQIKLWLGQTLKRRIPNVYNKDSYYTILLWIFLLLKILLN